MCSERATSVAAHWQELMCHRTLVGQRHVDDRLKPEAQAKKGGTRWIFACASGFDVRCPMTEVALSNEKESHMTRLPETLSVRQQTDHVAIRFHTALMSLITMNKALAHGQIATDAFERTHTLLAALPLTSNDFSVSSRRLSNTRHYHELGETGAAICELNLLMRCLDRIAKESEMSCEHISSKGNSEMRADSYEKSTVDAVHVQLQR